METPDDKFQINLTIVGKRYPLTIERSGEELYRRAEREINDLVAKYKNAFRGEVEDYLAMVALQIAVEAVKLEQSRSLGEEVDALKEMGRRLDNSLRELK
ncbi:MAG: cell division protein ZapA [Rikenellaceae bacterium]|jgi:cell division protein ZapA|nr:cell division protein ZapA [Rikenellaceae bacterium]